MEAKQGARSYVDFEPSFEWSRGEESDILRVHLPGFKREHIRVQVDNYGNLRTTGERPLEGNRWSRFWKDFRIPNNCSVNEIRAKFENETLFIMLPKEIARAKPALPKQLPSPSKPAAAPPKPVPATELPKPAVPGPKPTTDQAPVASPRDRPTNGKLRDMLNAEKEEKVVDDKERGRTAQPTSNKKETEGKEEKPVEEKGIEKPSITEAAGPAKEPARASGVATGLQPQRRGLLLNVAVAIIVLVGLGFYLSFKLRKGVSDGDENNTEEL